MTVWYKEIIINTELIRKTFRTAGGFRGTRLRSGVFCFFAPLGIEIIIDLCYNQLSES